MKKLFCLLMVLVSAFAFVACKEPENPTVELKSVSVVTPRNVARVQIGKTLQCSYKLNPTNATVEGNATWAVNKEDLGSITETGLFTAKAEGLVKITVTIGGVTGSKNIQVTTEAVEVYPDLGGYSIKIAQATIAMGETDPNYTEDTKAKYGYYGGPDRQARIDAWASVEEDFNCDLKVVEYPADAGWGPARWNYIANQARLDTPEYDLYTIPDAQVPELVSANALVDLTNLYNTYGNDFMTTLTKTAGSYQGRLYTINSTEEEIYNILGYNVGLWEKVHEYDATIDEPAKIFNDGKWDFSTFIDYAKKVQDALNSLYPEQGYYALSGWPTYYYVGMVDRNGTGVADIAAKKVHILGEDETAAGNALKEICDYGAFDTAFSVDGGVVSWSNGKALFNTGDLWFIGTNQDRWNADLWGEGELTRYGFVPFPAPDGMSSLEHTYVGLTSEACWVMAAGREGYYKGYGEECTTENIYYAVATYWQRVKSNYKNAASYDQEEDLTSTAQKKFATEESVKAFVTVSMNLKRDGFYDCMTSNSNTVCATYNSDLDIAIRNYVKGAGAATWAEAVGTLQDSLNDSITKAFG